MRLPCVQRLLNAAKQQTLRSRPSQTSASVSLLLGHQTATVCTVTSHPGLQRIRQGHRQQNHYPWAAGQARLPSWPAGENKGAPGRRPYSCEGGACCERTVVELASRTLVEVSGADAVDFLQGLVTCDIQEVGTDRPASHAMMLNVQGRVLYDLLVYALPEAEDGPAFLLECAREVKEELLKLMKRYKIRKKVKLLDCSDKLRVMAAVDGPLTLTSDPGKVVVSMADPRVPQFGQRLLLSDSNIGEVTEEQVKMEGEEHYHEKRYRWGIAEGTTDLPPGKALPLESNLVFTNGVSFTKGCYIGQELTARTHHTGVTRKRLMPLVFQRPPEGVEPGETISAEQKENVGKLRGWVGVVGLGLMRVADVGGQQLSIKPPGGGDPVLLTAHVPLWWPSQQ